VGSYGKSPEDLLDFTGDSFLMKEAIQSLTGPHRTIESFLYPALFSAVQRLCERHEKRRILLLFLEAVDPETAGKIRPLRNLLASSNVELFVVSFTSRMSTRGGCGQPERRLAEGVDGCDLGRGLQRRPVQGASGGRGAPRSPADAHSVYLWL